MSAADPTAERYATIMNNLIGDCTRLEDRVADLEAQLRATAQERDAAIAAQTAAERVRKPGDVLAVPVVIADLAVLAQVFL
eukprot:COSAG03_NODE_24231_length_274_cov_0.542857_1_plen_80_part_10